MNDAPGIGHNSFGVAADRLRSFTDRIERLIEEKQARAADIREVFCEAKAAGFDTKVLRIVIRMRKQDASDRQEIEALTKVYEDALGM